MIHYLHNERMPGRKPHPVNVRARVLSLSLPAALDDQVRQLAADEQRPLSVLVQRFLRAGMHLHGILPADEVRGVQQSLVEDGVATGGGPTVPPTAAGPVTGVRPGSEPPAGTVSRVEVARSDAQDQRTGAPRKVALGRRSSHAPAEPGLRADPPSHAASPPTRRSARSPRGKRST